MTRPELSTSVAFVARAVAEIADQRSRLGALAAPLVRELASSEDATATALAETIRDALEDASTVVFVCERLEAIRATLEAGAT